MKKYLLTALLVAFLVGSSPVLAEQQQSVEALMKQVQALLETVKSLQSQLSILQSGGTPTATTAERFCYNWSRNLTVGDRGSDIATLHKVLFESGYIDSNTVGGSITDQDNYFEEITASAVVEFQAKYGIRQTGYVGPMTRAKLNQLYGCTQTRPVPPPPVPPTTYCPPDAIPSSGLPCIEKPTTPPSIPFIQIISPNGGETYSRTETGASTFAVKWYTSNVPSSKIIDIIRLRAYPNGQEYNLATNVLNDGQEVIPVPSSVPAGAYTLEMKTYVGETLVMDSSDSYFKIVDSSVQQPSITVLSPNGGETYKLNDAMNVRWQSNGFTNNDAAKIYLGKQDIGSTAVSYELLTTIAATAGSQSIVLSKAISNSPLFEGRGGIVFDKRYVIRIEVGSSIATTPSLYSQDESDSSFTITAPTSTGNFQPADTNQDQRISIDEVTKYGSLYGNNSTTQEATLIWKNGEKYIKISSGFIPTHPADTNADGRISIDEVTAYGAKYGNTAEAQNAGTIWKKGGDYTFSSTGWVPLNATTSQPYISSVAGKAAGNGEIDAGGAVGIQGTNLLGGADTAYGTSIYIGGSQCNITQASNTLIYCTATSNLTAGSIYDLYLKNNSGTSNIVKVKVLSNATQPSITLTGMSGYQGSNPIQVSNSSLAVNIGSTFTISGTPQNLQGMSYYFGSGYPTSGYYNRAFFFDQNFSNNNSCGNNEAPSTGAWTMTCTAKVPGSSAFYVEIYANGQIYRSNTVTVTIPSSTQPTITVLSPNGGESLQSGSVQNIRWSSSGTIASVNIWLLDEAGQTLFVIANTQNSGSYPWNIPSDYPFNAKKFKIYVCENSAGGQCTETRDWSNSTFTITSPTTPQPSITIDGSQNMNSVSLVPGQTFQIHWTLAGLTLQQSSGAGVQLLLLDQNKNQLSNTTSAGVICLVCSSTNNSGWYNWTVPSGLPSGQYYIKAATVGGTSPYNVSTVSLAPLTITAPTSAGIYVTNSSIVSSQNIVTQTDNQILGGLDVRNDGQPVTVQKISFKFRIDSSSLYTSGSGITNIYLYNQNGTLLAGPFDAVNGIVNSTDAFVLPSGASTLVLKGRLNQNFSDGQTISAETYPATDWLPAGNYTLVRMSTMTVKKTVVPAQPSVTISSPTSGTTVGKVFSVSGSCLNYQGNVSVYYYSSQKITQDIPCSNGQWATSITLDTNAASGSFTLYATLSGGQQATVSLPFVIPSTTQPSITVLSPNGGETFTRGSQATIKWTQSVAMPVALNAAVDNGSYTIASMVNGVAGENSFAWTVGNGLSNSVIPDGRYQIMVHKYNATEINDKSDSYFTITSPTSATPMTDTEVIASLTLAIRNGTCIVAESCNTNFDLNGDSQVTSPDQLIMRSYVTQSDTSFDTLYKKTMAEADAIMGSKTGETRFIAEYDANRNGGIDQDDKSQISRVLIGTRTYPPTTSAYSGSNMTANMVDALRSVNPGLYR